LERGERRKFEKWLMLEIYGKLNNRRKNRGSKNGMVLEFIEESFYKY
jgi:hypothetical protein